MLRIDRRLISHFDWPLLVCTILVVVCGLATVLSASHSPDRLFSSSVLRQATWAGLGLVGMLAVISFDYHWLDRYGYLIFVGSMVLLLLVAVLGSSGGGARRWINMGPVSLQPSELAKLGLVIALSSVLHRYVGEKRLLLRHLPLPLIMVALPAVLILKQPDLGTAIVLCLSAGAILMAAGFRLRWVVPILAVVLPVLPYLWNHLKPYQQRRVLMFFNPDADPLGAGYHIIQSKIAIGSGMLYGKGYLHGTQNRLNFLPEQHTDFIFAVFAEEWGFMGACVLLTLYVALLSRCFIVISRARDPFGVLLAFGVTASIFGQVLVNIAMAAGALPVVGVTLPFFSYGGSSLLVSMMAIGVLLNISMRRYRF